MRKTKDHLKKKELEIKRIKALLEAKELRLKWILEMDKRGVFKEEGFKRLISEWYSDVVFLETKLELMTFKD